MNEKWFAMSVEEIEKKLKTNAASGLSPKAAASRCQNKDKPFFTVKKKRADKILLDLLSDFFLILLIFVSVFSLFFESDITIGLAMLILIAVNLALTFPLYFRDRRALDSMSEFFAPTARVIRGGKLYIADYRNVAVGDVIIVEKGDILGCDARLIHSDGLCVNMKIDKKNQKLLQKYAGASVNENELYAENMANMLHAGSTVEAGSGRAIVVATGEYTYLGARTGGITELPSTELPEGLAALKKTFSRVGMLLLVLTLPFCIFSLLFGHFTGGTVLLSEVLSVVLAVGATSMLSRCSNLLIGFFSRFIRKAALGENPCIIRSVSTLDKLADIDYLFMLDGSIVTDGILHFEGLATAEGDTNNLDQLGQSAKALADMIALYSVARSKAPALAGTSVSDMLETGLKEFMTKSRADIKALDIRCEILSYVPKVDGVSDILTYTDRGQKTEMVISSSKKCLEGCNAAIIGGVKKDITEDGRRSLINRYKGYVAEGKTPIIFILEERERSVFAGMLLLHEGIDTTVARSVSALRRNGVKIITFSNCVGRRSAPEIPAILRRGGRAFAGDFLRAGYGVTHDFGSYDDYCGFDSNMILELAKYVRSQNKSLAVLGFSDYASEVIDLCDVFISCAPVKTEARGYLEQEITSLEIPGEQSSASCTQKVKAEADVLLMRPCNARGGLEPLARTLGFCKSAYANLKSFLTYLVCVQLMRIIAVVFPMLLGNSVADARQLLFLGFVMDVFAMLIFMYDAGRGRATYKNAKKELSSDGIIGIVRKNSNLMVWATAGSVMTLLLPNILSLFDLFGSYIYKAEFTFISLGLMQIAAFALVYSKDIASAKRLLENKTALTGLGVFIVFTALCLLTPMGDLFGIVSIGIFYLLFAFVPTALFAVGYIVMGAKKRS